MAARRWFGMAACRCRRELRQCTHRSWILYRQAVAEAARLSAIASVPWPMRPAETLASSATRVPLREFRYASSARPKLWRVPLRRSTKLN